MPPKRRLAADDLESSDSDLSANLDSVAAAEMVKRLIESHKKRRHGIRQEIEKNYQKRVTEIRRRADQRFAECRTKLAQTHKEQLDRLIKAIEVRDAKQRAIAKKLARVYDECSNLAAQLNAIYDGRAEKARSTLIQTQKLATAKVDKGKAPAI